jgi:TonB family protein
MFRPWPGYLGWRDVSLLTRFLNLFRARSLDRDLADEVSFHLSERIASNVRQGMKSQDAEQAAHRQFGSVERAKEGMREVRVTTKLPLLTFVAGILVGAVAITILRPAISTRPVQEPEYYTVERQGVTIPALIHEVKPEYTQDAMRDKVAGTVVMTCIVQLNGSCEGPKVTKSLDPRLDREAVNALQNWRFRPGEYRGRAVPVKITIEMSFALR